MIHDKEIRAARDYLVKCTKVGCDCAPGDHRCEGGMQLMLSHIDILNWILGEPNIFERLLAEMQRKVPL
jgi:hypothetical protein